MEQSSVTDSTAEGLSESIVTGNSIPNASKIGNFIGQNPISLMFLTTCVSCLKVKKLEPMVVVSHHHEILISFLK